MSSEPARTPISDLGKYGLIDRITGKIKIRNDSTVIGAGDDSAAIDTGEKLTLVSNDLLLEGIHFNLVYTPLKHLGYKSVIRGISDIYAMNGVPGQVILSLGISSRFSVEMVDDFYEGATLACNKYGVDIAGGDTSSSLTGLTISITAIGSVAPGKIVRRSGAKPNDLICVTGDLGAAYMGLQLLERERMIFEKDGVNQPELKGKEYILERQLKPEFPSELPLKLEEASIFPTSMTDITEGLASDLLQICKSSGTGCRVFREKIPVDTETARMAEEFRIDPLIPALNGGEDYELLFTIPLEDFEKIRLIESVRVIGHITSEDYGKYLVSGEGQETELTAQGWKK
jgi:thiamine-monophosphate kinase